MGPPWTTKYFLVLVSPFLCSQLFWNVGAKAEALTAPSIDIFQDLDVDPASEEVVRVKKAEAILPVDSAFDAPDDEEESSRSKKRAFHWDNDFLNYFPIRPISSNNRRRPPPNFKDFKDDDHSAGAGHINHFYYFNEDLPPTSPGAQGLPHELKTEKKRSNFRSSKKRQLQKNRGEHGSKEPKWTPLHVSTLRGPFHFHLPILRSKMKHNHDFTAADVLEEATLYKNPLDFGFASLTFTVDDSPMPRFTHLSRKRRGVRSWIKEKFFRRKKTTTTPRPTPPPPTPDPYDSYSAEMDGNGFNPPGRGRSMRPQRVQYHADQHGDTEVDWLLPRSLRRSYILAKKKGQKPGSTGNSLDGDSNAFAQGEYNDKPVYFNEPRRKERPPPPPTGSRRRNGFQPRRRRPYPPRYRSDDWDMDRRRPNYAFTEFPDPDPMDYAYDDYGPPSGRRSEPNPYRMRRVKRAATLTSSSGEAIARSIARKRESPPRPPPPMNLPWEPITLVSLDAEPITFASKEELRLLHELLVNIVTEKCPKGFQASFAELIEENLFKTVDLSTWPKSDEETSPQMTALIHQLVNCSVAAEGQRDVLQMLAYEDRNKFHTRNEIEVGSPLFRRKRGRHHLRRKPTRQSFEESRRRLTNIEFALVSFAAVECKHHVDNQLLLSASQLMLETIAKQFSLHIPIEEEETTVNLNILQNCASLIMKHREHELRLKRKLQDTVRRLHRKVPMTLIPLGSRYDN